MSRYFSPIQKFHCLCGLNILLFCGQRRLFLQGKKSDRGVKLTTHFRLMQTLRISGSIPPYSIYDFVEWIGAIICIYLRTLSYRVIQKDGLNFVHRQPYLLKLVIPTTNALPRWRLNVGTKTKRTLYSSRRLSFNELTNAKNHVLHSSHFAVN